MDIRAVPRSRLKTRSKLNDHFEHLETDRRTQRITEVTGCSVSEIEGRGRSTEKSGDELREAKDPYWIERRSRRMPQSKTPQKATNLWTISFDGVIIKLIYRQFPNQVILSLNFLITDVCNRLYNLQLLSVIMIMRLKLSFIGMKSCQEPPTIILIQIDL